ncbi:MAG: TIGR04211 family SH3 domain-containing protein [Gammaproteobacteria bacterium]|nr:TIGR04211 family SH3 domain-containing protein [Gammaproteobacteria bacterium]
MKNKYNRAINFQRVIAGMLLILFSSVSFAENMYVTDRILLGVHESPEKNSILVDSVPSGTSLKVLDENNGFKKVKLPGGTEGWVDSAFLVTEQPAPAQYDILLSKHQRLQEELKKISEKLKKTERELQVRRDEVSNAKSALKDLKKKQKQNSATTNASADTAELDAANAEVEKLKQQIVELKAASEKVEEKIEMPPGEAQVSSALMEQELEMLRMRIELAMQNLKGEEMLTLDEVVKIRPAMPNWFWGTLVLFLVLGAAGGVMWMDYRNRKRHGGFRV